MSVSAVNGETTAFLIDTFNHEKIGMFQGQNYVLSFLMATSEINISNE